MNKAITELSDFCTENHMPINTPNTYYHIFTLCHTEPDISVRFNKIIKQIQNYYILDSYSTEN